MRKIILLSLIFTLCIILISCDKETTTPEADVDTTSPIQTRESAPKVPPRTNFSGVDCRTDLRCLIPYAQRCEPASVIHTVTLDIFGVEQTTSSYFEVRGSNGEKCVFYLRTDEVDIKYTDGLVADLLANGMTPEEIRQQEENSRQIQKSAEGREGSCKFNTVDLVALLDNWAKGNLGSGDFDTGEDCQGSYFNPSSEAEWEGGEPLYE